MPDPSRLAVAVFLSYASQDEEAAARICDALRTAGVEVWFDKSELRGGDAWDLQIKKQIHECALFVPIISASTNARKEGYFRREWNLATRRMLDMATDAAFLVPVVVDETREADARVPEEFFNAQWTWLPGGVTPLAFAERVRELLGADGASAPARQFTESSGIERSARIPHSRTRLSPPIRLIVTAVIALIGLGTGAIWYHQRSDNGSDLQQVSPAASHVETAAPNKSIAVLPFADMSAGKDQEYFADGLSEELLSMLSKLPELRVIGRTSSFQFKERNEDLRAIGEKLNVSHILEGSVRKSGKKLRITAQLIRAEDGSHIWSESYDRTLDDIFAVQDDIADQVVKALKLTLLGATSATRSRPVDPEAYNLVLQGRFLIGWRGWKDLERAVEYFRHALELDPDYAPAWVGLSYIYAHQAGNGFAPIADGYRRAREAAERALALDPQLADAHLALGSIHRNYDWDWDAADASYRRALELEPGSALALRRVGALSMVFGRWDEAIDLTNKSIERDPLRAGSYRNLGLALLAVNRDTEAESAARKSLELNPDGAGQRMNLGLALLLQGKTDAALQAMQQETAEMWRLTGLPLAFHALGRRSESDAALAELKSKFAGEGAYQIAEVHAFRGEVDLAFEWLERAYDQRDGGVTEIKGDRLMRGLVGDPRYKAFLRKLKLPERN